MSEKRELKFRVLPRAVTERGDLFMATLTGEKSQLHNVVCQLSKIDIGTDKAEIFFYPTPEQALWFWGNPQFCFEGRIESNQQKQVIKGKDVWVEKGPVRCGREDIPYFTDCSGSVSEITTVTDSLPKARVAKSKYRIAFYVSKCFAAGILSNRKDDAKIARRYKFPKQERLFFNIEGGTAEFQPVDWEPASHRVLLLLRGVKDMELAEKAANALILLAAFASRSWAFVHGFSYDVADERVVDRRYFDRMVVSKDRNDPLLLRNRLMCFEFLQSAYDVRLKSIRPELLDGAIHAVLPRSRTVEGSIITLFSALQSALMFALGRPKKKKREIIKVLFAEFQEKFQLDATDLWPVFDSTNGPSLYDLRNALVHGDVFSLDDFLALSYAAEHLHALVERVILSGLNWDVSKSRSKLAGATAMYEWDKARNSLRL